MPSPSDSLFSRTVDHAGRVWPLAVVPLVVTLLDWARLQTLLANTDRVFSVTFGVPRPVSSLWSFVNAQPEGFSTGAPGVDSVAVFVVALLASAVVSGVLAAGYLSSMNAALDGRFDFLAAVRQYARPLVGYALLEAGVGLALVAAGIGATPLFLLVGVALFVLAYLFFTTPYLVVVEDRGLAPALRHAFELATNDGRVLAFFLGYVVVSAILSVPISWIAFNTPPLGVAVAVLVSAPLALLLNVATLLFVRDRVGRGQSSSNIPVDM
jgi:hypothetical protein